jgi:glycogen debranching enzyme
MKEELIETARQKAVEVLRICSTKNGLYASGGKKGYASVWARDSMISMIGASHDSGQFRKVFEKSLETLALHQSIKGQIPNDVDIFEKARKEVTYATIDSSLWFVLGEYYYKKKFGLKLWEKHGKNIWNAMNWAGFQDAGEDLMPEQQPTSDWEDCFPHKYGHTINTQALYFAALCATGRRKIIPKFRKQVYRYLWHDEGYFLPWHWKDHEKYSEKETWFDSLGNMLAIAFGLATKKQAESILDFAENKKIAEPFPMKAIYPPIKRGSPEWKDYFGASLAGTPNNYLNGGIWPFIGGFYVCALVETGRKKEAEMQLEKLAHANKMGKAHEWDFNEWINPVTKKPEGGRHQAWSAGCYLLAHQSVKMGRNPLKAKF